MYYFICKGETYTFDPRNQIIEGWDEENEVPIIGSQTLQEVLGMTDEEADAAHLEGLKNHFIRPERNKLLSECDWTLGEDSPLTDEKKAEWRTYRQELRNMTAQSDPQNANWPTKPS